jgi:hypothetical protein
VPFNRLAAKSGVAYLVEERINPSAEYFIIPMLSACGFRIVRCGFADIPAPADIRGAVVIFVRYVPPNWLKLVESVRPHLRALAFFMDDDVLEIGASVGMPWRYRFKLGRLATGQAGWLRRQNAELWVSTPYLKAKYADWEPKLVLPYPVTTPHDVRRVFYHGSASHAAEIRWLGSVMEEVLSRDRRLTFEIVGGQDVYRLYRGLPRVNVVHPMRWGAYQHFLSMPGRHIGLAPLLDLPFNRARSYTKFFDITRCGAVGIYSSDSVYSEVISDGINGLLVKLVKKEWVEAILSLALDEPRRQDLLRNAVIKSSELASFAQGGFAEFSALRGDDGAGN